MDKYRKIGLLMIVVLLLAACGADDAVEVILDPQDGSKPGSVDEEDTGNGEGDSQERSREELRADFADNALPPASQLLLGTFLLEDAEFAVDADLAPYLVPYWKLYKSLLESDTTAPEELEALIAEIQEVMNVDQVNYIASLELTQEDLTTYMNESGIMENMRPEGAEEGDGTGTRPDRPDGMPAGTLNEVIIEFQQIGNAVKVTAVDPESLIEVSIVGPSGAGEEILKRTAIRKLEYVIEKRRKEGVAR